MTCPRSGRYTPTTYFTGGPRSKRSNPTEEGGFAGVEEIRRRFRAVRAKGLPYLVAEIEGAVCGYAYAAPYHRRPAYRHAVENSVYVDQGAGVSAARSSTR